MKTYYNYSPTELVEKAKIKLQILSDDQAVFLDIAKEMHETIVKNNEENQRTVFICPVGPVGQYPHFVQLVNQFKTSLKQVWFINMDEYLTPAGSWLPLTDDLSFRKIMNTEVYAKISPELVMPEEQRVFPDPQDIHRIPQLIQELGGVDIAFGGIGINGHVAFNEPNQELSHTDFLAQETRVLTISEQTRAVNSIGALNGAIELMPKECVTIGMSEINQAKKIRLSCFRDWHKGVVRRSVCGEMSSEFPVTLLQNHSDISIRVTEFVANY